MGARIRTFGRRQGRKLRAARQQVLKTGLTALGVDQTLEEGFDPKTLFPIAPVELWLEIGFGSGDFMVGQAKAYPEIGIFGCEPYVNGVSTAMKLALVSKVKNIRVFHGDARDVLTKAAPASFQRVFILFPDPWPKKRHWNRRLVQLETMELVARAMPPGGELLLATDHAGYAEWMIEHMIRFPEFEWTARTAADFNSPPDGWIPTRYQQKARLEGRNSVFLRFVRSRNVPSPRSTAALS